MTAQLDEIKKAHHALMVEYVNILNRVSKLHFFVDFQVTFPINNDKLISIGRLLMKYLTLAFLVRLFAEFHIKGKLRELNASYVRHALVVDELSMDKYQEWSKQTNEASAKFIDTLSLWQSLLGIVNNLWLLVSGLIITIFPFLLGVSFIAFVFTELANLAGKLSDIETNSSNLSAQSTASEVLKFLIQSDPGFFKNLAIVLFLVAFLLILISLAFAYKRSLFLPGSGFLWFDFVDTERARATNNVYEMEDGLFDLLEKGKIQEFPKDIATFALFWIILGVICILIPFFEKRILSSYLYIIVYYSGILIFWILGFLAIWKIRHLWRFR